MTTTTKVRGVTPAEREETRRERSRQRLTRHYSDRIAAATSPRQRLNHACDYLRAVACRLTRDEQDELAREVRRMADERNQP